MDVPISPEVGFLNSERRARKQAGEKDGFLWRDGTGSDLSLAIGGVDLVNVDYGFHRC